MIGAGGAARAIVYGLSQADFSSHRLANRTLARAETLAAHFGGPVMATPGPSCRRNVSAGADLLVNASSLGMTGLPGLNLDLRALPARAVVADVVYVPLADAADRGGADARLRAVDGLGMLLHQAAPAFARWFGRRPEVTAELRALVEADVRAKEAARMIVAGLTGSIAMGKSTVAAHVRRGWARRSSTPTLPCATSTPADGAETVEAAFPGVRRRRRSRSRPALPARARRRRRR